jgi:hypothetical protein
MSEPRTDGQPAVAPVVSTAPAPHRRRIPSHLGPARTSTVVLSVLFLGIFALYLNVKPDAREAANTDGGTVVDQPVTPPPTVEPTPTETPEPTVEPGETAREESPPADGTRTPTRTPTTTPETTGAPMTPRTSTPSLPTTAAPTG